MATNNNLQVSWEATAELAKPRCAEQANKVVYVLD